ncbi:hypothetical protein N9M53_04150 [Alphaproteobacteria bacterium]|nr:hypothetical protein [Alphaproteobacteria bacterium]
MSKRFEVSVEFGTDTHSVALSEEEWVRVKSGGILTKRFRDSIGGESYIFKYQFNSKKYPEHTLVMHYDEGEGFMGDIEEACVNELGD